ncbi:MAG: hypothetical protein QOF94_549, partial [Acidobacteriaceae bacterium]
MGAPGETSLVPPSAHQGLIPEFSYLMAVQLQVGGDGCHKLCWDTEENSGNLEK